MNDSNSNSNALSRTLAFYEACSEAADEEGLRSIDAQAMALLLSQPPLSNPGARLLDAGCGGGADLAAFLRHGIDARGIDACGALVERACSKGLPTVRSDLRLAKLERASLDAVWCKRVLPHFPSLEDFQRVLIAFFQALKPAGGLLYLTAFTGEGSLEDQSIAGAERAARAEFPARRWFAVEEKALLPLLRQSGFTPVMRAEREPGIPAVREGRPHWRELALLLRRV